MSRYNSPETSFECSPDYVMAHRVVGTTDENGYCVEMIWFNSTIRYEACYRLSDVPQAEWESLSEKDRRHLVLSWRLFEDGTAENGL
jgi:hypothetical protein